MAGLVEWALQQGFLPTFNPQISANTAWAFATLGIQNEIVDRRAD